MYPARLVTCLATPAQKGEQLWRSQTGGYRSISEFEIYKMPRLPITIDFAIPAPHRVLLNAGLSFSCFTHPVYS